MRPAISIPGRYTTAYLPWLKAKRRWPRISLALLFTCFVATGAYGWAVVFLEESVPQWGIIVLFVVTVLSGVIAWEALTTLRRSFREHVLDALLREAWPHAQIDVHGRLSDHSLNRAGFFLFAPRREFHGLVRLHCSGLPVALCVGETFRVHERSDNRRDERLFCGTLFEFGASLPLTEPVVIATRAVHERPVPPGSAGFTTRSRGEAEFDKIFNVWATSDTAARAAIPTHLAACLVDIARRLPKSGALRLVLDRDGVIGALDGPTASAQLYPYGALPRADDLAAEVERIATVCEIADACAEGLKSQPRELNDFAGDYRPASRQKNGVSRPLPADTAAALDLLHAAGIRVDNSGSHLHVEYPAQRTGLLLAVSVVLSAALTWVLLHLHGLGWEPTSSAAVGTIAASLLQIPGVDLTLVWLLSWHPWSTLLVVTTPVPLLWQWALQEPRTLHVSRTGVHTVRGIAGRSANLPLQDDAILRVDTGRIYLDARPISPNLNPAIAVALAQLIAPHLDCTLSIPHAGR